MHKRKAKSVEIGNHRFVDGQKLLSGITTPKTSKARDLNDIYNKNDVKGVIETLVNELNSQIHTSQLNELVCYQRETVLRDMVTRLTREYESNVQRLKTENLRTKLKYEEMVAVLLEQNKRLKENSADRDEQVDVDELIKKAESCRL